MKFYHEASKVVKPKMEALAIAGVQMKAANNALAAAETRISACNEKLAELQTLFNNQMSRKRSIEEGAIAPQNKMNQASALINGLSNGNQDGLKTLQHLATKRNDLLATVQLVVRL